MRKLKSGEIKCPQNKEVKIESVFPKPSIINSFSCTEVTLTLLGIELVIHSCIQQMFIGTNHVLGTELGTEHKKVSSVGLWSVHSRMGRQMI